ncbi:hypothetical protein IKU74_04420, partial [bacterium]|nr:hypothetical protein [bacterium]
MIREKSKLFFDRYIILSKYKKEGTEMSEEIKKEFALENVITSAVQIPGVKVDRRKFLSEFFSSEEYAIQDILEFGPIQTGVPQEKLAKIADKLILKRTSQSSL